jgi:WD40 repeat protein
MSNLRRRLVSLSQEMRRYTLNSLPHHLIVSLQTDRLHFVLTDFDFLEAKILDFGVQSLIEDYELALKSNLPISGQKAHSLKLIQDAIRLSKHILQSEPTQLAGQLLGRLLNSKDSDIQRMLDQIKSITDSPWLRPLTPMLTPPGGPLRQTLIGHTGEINTLAVTPDGKLAVSGSTDNTLKVWDLHSGTELLTLTGHSDGVRAVAITPDGKQVISASGDTTLKVWDLARGQELHTLTGHSNSVYAVAITPDGRFAVSGSKDNTLKVWDLARGQELHTLTGHNNSVRAVAISADGRFAVSASEDRTLKVWDLLTGNEVATFSGDSGFKDCALAPDGVTVVAGDESGRVHFLRLEGV